jgi:hypothetical protein
VNSGAHCVRPQMDGWIFRSTMMGFVLFAGWLFWLPFKVFFQWHFLIENALRQCVDVVGGIGAAKADYFLFLQLFVPEVIDDKSLWALSECSFVHSYVCGAFLYTKDPFANYFILKQRACKEYY